MSRPQHSVVHDLTSSSAPPRRNGELVFGTPWESRAFGLAVALHQAGTYDWETFRRRLIDEIGRWEGSGDEPVDWNYYRLWLAALERVLVDQGILDTATIDARAAAVAARPPEADHRHEHPEVTPVS